MSLFICNVAPVACIAATAGTSGLAHGLPAIPGVIDISVIILPFDHSRTSSASQLINGKSKDLQKLLKYFNGTTTSASNILLLFDVLPISFVLYSKGLAALSSSFISCL